MLGYFASLLFYSGFLWVFLFYLVVFVLLITIFKRIKKLCFGKRDSTSSSIPALKSCLKNEEIKKLFMEFSDSEWSSENYLIYFDIEDYMKLPKDQRKEFALKIYSLYLNGKSSELEVNIPRSVADEVKFRMDLGEFEDDLFKDVKIEIEDNMKDTLKRFLFTSEYRRHSSHIEFLIDQTGRTSSKDLIQK